MRVYVRELNGKVIKKHKGIACVYYTASIADAAEGYRWAEALGCGALMLVVADSKLKTKLLSLMREARA